MADDSLRKAAADAMKAGEDVTRRVREITLNALKNTRFDRESIRETVRAVTEGMAAAAPASGGSLRKAMGQAFRGMDEALTKSVEAGEGALRQMLATGRSIDDNEVKQALAGLKKIEEDFVSTVSQVASSANERVRPELSALVERATNAGTETGRQTAHLMKEFTFTGLELAGQFSVRFMQVASGVLAGMADALEKSAAERRKKAEPPAEKRKAETPAQKQQKN